LPAAGVVGFSAGAGALDSTGLGRGCCFGLGALFS